MFTKKQLLQAIPDVPAEFSLAELETILNRPHLPATTSFSVRPATPATTEIIDLDRYMSPEALALYAKFPISPGIAALRGIAANLPLADLQKSAKEWEAERIREKYGV